MIFFDELDFEHGLNTLDGKPFSGIVYEKRNDGGWDEVTMVNGIQSGITREWYPTGILKVEKHMENNYVHGMKWEWNNKGEMISEEVFEFGILVRRFEFDNHNRKIEVFEISSKDPHFKNLEGLRKARRKNFFSVPRLK